MKVESLMWSYLIWFDLIWFDGKRLSRSCDAWFAYISNVRIRRVALTWSGCDLLCPTGHRPVTGPVLASVHHLSVTQIIIPRLHLQQQENLPTRKHTVSTLQGSESYGSRDWKPGQLLGDNNSQLQLRQGKPFTHTDTCVSHSSNRWWVPRINIEFVLILVGMTSRWSRLR
jgi:hypothetical protein